MKKRGGRLCSSQLLGVFGELQTVGDSFQSAVIWCVGGNRWLLGHSPLSSRFPFHDKVVILAANKRNVSRQVWPKWVELHC